jgi:hypothetical protein
MRISDQTEHEYRPGWRPTSSLICSGFDALTECPARPQASLCWGIEANNTAFWRQCGGWGVRACYISSMETIGCWFRETWNG